MLNTLNPGTRGLRTGDPATNAYAVQVPEVLRARAYRPLPICDGQQPDETLSEDAARLLRFLLSENLTATLSDDQLALADMAAQRAASQVRADDGRASKVDAAQLQTLQTLTDARHRIAQALRWRAEMHREAAQDAPGTTIAPTGGGQGGQAARLQPAPPSVPPAPAYAQPQPAARRF